MSIFSRAESALGQSYGHFFGYTCLMTAASVEIVVGLSEVFLNRVHLCILLY